MKKSPIIILAACAMALASCNSEEEVAVEPALEDVETSEEDALADAIENAESAADAMGKELSDATAPEVSAPELPVAASEESSEDAAQ